VRDRFGDVVNGGQAVAAALAAEGVDIVFGIPGTHCLELYRGFGEVGIRPMTTRHEQGAAFAADGYSRAGGSPGVIVTTSGPGLLNATTGLGTSYADSVAVLVVSPGPPTGWRAGADTGSLHELKSQRDALDAIVERSIRVASAAEAAHAIAATFAHWRRARPRPVHLEIPLNVLEAATAPAAPALSPVPDEPPPRLDERALDEAAALLAAASKPLLVVGGGCVRAGPEVTALAEQIGAPVLTSLNGKGVVDERHPLSLGSSLRLRAAHRLIRECDVVLVVGATLGQAELWGGEVCPSEAIIRIDIDPTQLTKNASAGVGIAGDAECVLKALAQRLPLSSPRADAATRASAARALFAAELWRHAAPWAPIHDALAAALPPDAIIAGDSSQVSYNGTASLWRARGPRQFLFPAGFAPLGYGLPAAIGAKLACPARAVAAVVGDGAFVFTADELLTAEGLRLGIPVIVANNAGFGEIRDRMDERGIPRVGVDLEPPNLLALARAYRCEARRVLGASELHRELSAAIRREVPTVLEVVVADGP
jgi:acetolactate synthase-1/2/3 large subunit